MGAHARLLILLILPVLFGGAVFLAQNVRALPSPLTVGCVGGVCYWIGGAGVFSDTAHWSVSSGGASCGCTPAFADVLIFDSSSGTGTATNDVASFSSGTIYTSLTNMVIAASSSHWTFQGSISDAGGHITYGTSTFEFASNGAGITEPAAYNIIIDSGIGVTLYTHINVYGVLTINGTLTYKDNRILLYGSPGIHDPLVFGPSGSQVASGGTDGNLFFIGSTYQNIPGHSDYDTINLEPLADGAYMNLSGNVQTVTLFTRLDSVGAWSFDTKGFNLNATYLFRTHSAAGSETTGNLMHFRNSHLVVASVDWEDTGKASPQFENSTWTVTGAWNNGYTSVESWDPGHSQITLTFPSGVPTSSVQFGDPAVVGNEFWNLTVISAFASNAWINMTVNTLHVAHALTIGPDPSGQTTLGDGGFGITVGCLLLKTNGFFTGTFNETVGPGCDRAPALSPSLTLVRVHANTTYRQVFSATDADNDTLTWGFVSNNSYLSFGSSNHTVYGMPQFVGTFFVNVSVSDGILTAWDNYTLIVLPPGVFPLSGMNLVLIELVLFILAFVILTVLGFGYHPGFLLLDGVLMLYFAFWTYTIIADTVIASVFAAIGVGFILFGFIAHPQGRPTR